VVIIISGGFRGGRAGRAPPLTAIVNLHAPIKLVCNATGGIRPPQQIDWFFDGHMIREGDSRRKSRLRISNHVPDIPGRMLVSELTIDYSEFNDKGKKDFQLYFKHLQ
jgi:hypothetical protein